MVEAGSSDFYRSRSSSLIPKTIHEVSTEDCRIFFFRLQENGTMSNCSLDNQRAYLKAFLHGLLIMIIYQRTH